MICCHKFNDKTFPYEMLSNYCKKVANEYGIKAGDVEKLIPNLSNKTNY